MGAAYAFSLIALIVTRLGAVYGLDDAVLNDRGEQARI